MRNGYRLLLALLFLALSGCEVGGAPGGVLAPTGTPDDQRAVGLEADGQPITISFAGQSFERSAYEPLIEQFNAENPGIRVQFVSIDDLVDFGGGRFDANDYTRRIVSGADTASLFTLSDAAAERGFFTNLSPLIDADPAFERDDFYPGALERGTIDGNVYMLPSHIQVSLLSYNRALWERAGLPEPQIDWAWGDLIAAAEQLAQKRGDTVDVYGLIELSNGFGTLVAELEAAGIAVYDTPVEELRLDDPAVVAALTRVAELIDTGAIYTEDQNQPIQPDVLRQLVSEERVAMWQPEVLEFGGPEEPPELGFEVGLVPFPALANGFSRGAQGYVISGGTAHPEEAWRWLSFLSRQQITSPFGPSNSLSQLPARKSLAEASNYWDGLDEQSAATVRAAIDLPPPDMGSPNLDNLDLVYSTLRNALNSVIAGEETPDEALAKAQAQLEEDLLAALNQPTATPDNSPIIVATPVPNQAPEGATVITFSTLGFSNDINQAARSFNQSQTDVFVELRDTSAYTGPVSLEQLAADSDCFAWWGTPGSDEYTATLDLQPLIDADASFPEDDYPPALLAPYRNEAGLYGLPHTVGLRTLNYNLEAFEQAGLQPPSASWTPDDFLNAAQQLSGGEGSDARYGYAVSGSGAQDLDLFLGLFGAQLQTGAAGAEQPNYTDPTVLQAARYYVDLNNNTSPHESLSGYTPDSWGSDAFQLINEGRVGMWLEYSNRFVVFGQRQRFTTAIAPPPMGDRGVSQGDFDLISLYISATSANSDGCWTFLKYLTEEASESDGRFPARISVAESDAFTASAAPGTREVYAAYRAAFERSQPNQDSDDKLEINMFWFYRAVDRAIGGADLEEELAEAQRLATAYVECVRANSEGTDCATTVDPTYNGFGSSVSDGGSSVVILP